MAKIIKMKRIILLMITLGTVPLCAASYAQEGQSPCDQSPCERPGDQAPMVLHYDRPADFFEESLPIGNGKLGALVYGGTDDNIIYLNDITLWTGKPVDRNLDADAHQWIPAIREALFNAMFRDQTANITSPSAHCTSKTSVWGLSQTTTAASASTAVS